MIKNYILLLLFSAYFAFSCSKSEGIEGDLVGEWVYERETFNSNIIFIDPDTRGIITFYEDETGLWFSDDANNFSTLLEWDLQSNESEIAITRKFDTETLLPSTTRIYKLNQMDQNNFTLTYEFTLDTIIDGEPTTLSQFENIILTRK